MLIAMGAVDSILKVQPKFVEKNQFQEFGFKMTHSWNLSHKESIKED